MSDAIESTQLMPHWREGATAPAGRDHAQDAVADGGLPLPTLERFLEDLRWAPDWRREADMCADYYDGNQLSRETLEALEDRGLGPLQRNLIAPTVDAVLGLEEKNRQDWRVVTDLDEQQEVAEALSFKLAEAERESQADRAISDAYAGAVKAGFAAVEVSRASNPFDYEYRVDTIHRRELFWDPRSRRPDWKDARFLMRRRWFDPDVVAAHFPAHRLLIRFAADGWTPGWEDIAKLVDSESTLLQRALDVERSSKIEEQEWRELGRGRVCVYEVWYRTFHRGLVLKLPNGRRIEFDRRDPRHVALVTALGVQPVDAVFDRYRCAYFVGPHRIADFASTRRAFPYVPFWGKREDLTGSPYGLIRGMMSVQDEINARLAKMMWLLSSHRTIIDDDAVSGTASEFNNMADVSREVGRANSFIVLNSARRNTDALRVDENLELADAQHRAMQDALLAMSQVSGVYSQMLGNPGNLTANSAIKTILDQGTVTLAEINANYIYGRRLVGQQLLELIKEDSLHPHQLTIETGTSKKKIFLNQRSVDPATNLPLVDNSVSDTPVKVQLSDVPSTASYRQQQLVSLSEVAKSLPPEVQGVLAPYLLEHTDLPNRKELAKVLRERMGIAADPKTEEGQAILAQQAEMKAVNDRAMAAEIDVKESTAAKLKAEAAKIIAESDPQFMREQKAREHEATMAQIQGQTDNERAKAQASIETTRAKADADVEIARTQAASDDKVKALSEEFDQRLKEFEQLLKERQQDDDEEAEGKPPVIVDVNGNVAKEMKAQHAERVKARQVAGDESKKNAAALTKAIEQMGQLQAATLRNITDAQASALSQLAQAMEGHVKQLLEARPAAKERPAATSREVEVTDPDTGKKVRAVVRSRKDESGKMVREVEMVDPVTGKSVRTSRSE